MKTFIKVSIVIPVYNVESYIERCLLSVLRQTYSNIEIIFVNDFTPDDSIKIVESYLLINPFEKRVTIVHHDENKGLSEARNTGINIAKGNYIYFLDSDDELTLDCIESLVESCDGEDIVLAGFLKSDGSLFCETSDKKFVNEDVLNSYFSGEIYDMACNKLVEKDFIVKNELFFKPRIIHEDLLWTYKCCLVAKSVRTIKKSTYIYHIMEGTLNTNFTNRNLESLSEIYVEIKKDIILNKIDTLFFVNKYLLNLVLGIKIKALKSSKVTINDFKNNDFILLPFKYFNFQLALKYLLLRAPLFFQFVFIKTYLKAKSLLTSNLFALMIFCVC